MNVTVEAKRRFDVVVKSKGCGADTGPDGGFGAGNDCAGGDVASSKPGGSKDKPTEDEIDRGLQASAGRDLEHNQYDKELPSIDEDRLSIVGATNDLEVVVADNFGGASGIRENGPHEFFFYGDGQTPAGYAKATKTSGTISFNMIALKEEFQGQGFGTDLYKFFLDDLNLEIKSDSEQSPAAQATYRRLINAGYPVRIDEKDGLVVLQPKRGKGNKSYRIRLKASGCGANTGSDGGFGTGNSCAGGEGKPKPHSAPSKVERDRTRREGLDPEIAEFLRQRDYGDKFDPATHGLSSPMDNMQASVDKILDQPDNVMSGWFRDADDNYKPRLVRQISKDPGLLSAGHHVMFDQWQVTGSKHGGITAGLSKEEFLDTPFTLYRGGDLGQPGFDSYSMSREVAEGFARQNGTTLREITIKPKDTYGMYQTIAELEVLVPSEVSAATGREVKARPSKHHIRLATPNKIIVKVSECGANTGADGGFGAGNDCAGGGGSSSKVRTGKATKEEVADFKEFEEDELRRIYASEDEPLETETLHGHKFENIDEKELNVWGAKDNESVENPQQNSGISTTKIGVESRLLENLETENADGSVDVKDNVKFYTSKGDGIVNSFLRDGETRDAKLAGEMIETLDAKQMSSDMKGLKDAENVKAAANNLAGKYQYVGTRARKLSQSMTKDWEQKTGSVEEPNRTPLRESLDELHNLSLATERAQMDFRDVTTMGNASDAEILAAGTLFAETAKKAATEFSIVRPLMNQVALERMDSLNFIANKDLDKGKTVTVFRGLPIDTPKTKRLYDRIMAGGKKFQVQGFGSSSLDFQVAQGFATGNTHRQPPVRMMMKIKTKKGAYIDGLSNFMGEKEVLLPSGSIYSVTSSRLVRLGKEDIGKVGPLALLVEMTRESKKADEATKSLIVKVSECGANTGADGGFGPGNDCADGDGSSEKEESPKPEERQKEHLHGAEGIEEFAQGLKDGNIPAHAYKDTSGYFKEQMERAIESGDHAEGMYWNNQSQELDSQVYYAGLVDENGEVVIPSKSEPWPDKKAPVPKFENIEVTAANRQDHLNTLKSERMEMSNTGKFNPTPEEAVPMHDLIRDDLVPKSKDRLELQTATVHMDAEDLQDVLFDGGIYPMSHPDIGESTNAVTAHRQEIEGRMGLSESDTWSDRPVYAAFTDDNWEDGPRGHGAAGDFGNVQVNLKDSVLERSTVTFGDSGEGLMTTPGSYSYPSPVSYERLMNGEASEEELIGMYSHGYAYSMTSKKPGRHTWTEAQVWGGVNIGDIESVHLSPAALAWDHSNKNRLTRRLKKNNIAFTEAEEDWD